MKIAVFASGWILLSLLLCPTASGDTAICRPNSGDTDGHNNWKALLANKDYSAQQAPTMEEPGADQVYIAIQILDIDEVNEQQMYYQIQMFIISAWIDPRLEVASLKEGTRVLLPDDAFHCFWSPSLIFDNNKDGKHFFLSVPNTLMAIYSNKTVLKASRLFPNPTPDTVMTFTLDDEAAIDQNITRTGVYHAVKAE